MSLFNTLNTGASGMGASSTNLSVIGDNIANLGTVGYKGSTASFADNFPSSISTLGGPRQIGGGSALGDVSLDFAQGTLNPSANALDVAIVGAGFFQVSAGDETLYSRDGSFRLDVDNYIVNSSGLRLQGYKAKEGQVGTAIGDLRVDGRGLPQRATTDVVINATLSAEADASTTPVADLRAANAFDGSAAAATIEDLSTQADFSTSVTVYDSLGLPHDVTLFFERDATSPSTWNMYAVADGSQIDTNGDGVTDGVEGAAFEIGSGTVTFGTDGHIDSTTGITLNAGWTYPNADALDTTFSFGLDATGNPVDGELRMTGTTSYLTGISQDGYPAGALDGVRVDADGTITGNYTNGQEQALGRIALATFASNNGLDRAGLNLYRATNHSGEPVLGAPGAGGRGTTSGFALEGSNVELEKQFVMMIQAQRAYQANTGVIRSADEALQLLINLV